MNSRSTREQPVLAVLTVVVAFALAACGSSQAERDTVTVVATTTILGDVASNIVGDDGTVLVLMPVGADPHDFRASAAQVAAINEADLVIANGLLLEEGLEDVLATASDDGVDVLSVGPLLDPLPFGGHEDHHDDRGDDDHGGLDPHVWLDPLRMAEAARLIGSALTQAAPGPDWSGRADSYVRQLEVADERIVEILAAVPESQRRLVTSHASFGYFADRYEFEVLGTVLPPGSTLSGASSEELANLVETMRSAGVAVIFGETTQPEALAQTVAAELGTEVLVVSLYTGSLGEPGSGAESLIDLLMANASRIAEALGG